MSGTPRLFLKEAVPPNTDFPLFVDDQQLPIGRALSGDDGTYVDITFDGDLDESYCRMIVDAIETDRTDTEFQPNVVTGHPGKEMLATKGAIFLHYV